MPRYQNVTSNVLMYDPPYDPKCESFLVGVRSVLIAAQRDLKECLADFGIGESDYALLRVIVDDAGIPTTMEQVQRAVRFCPVLEQVGKAFVRKYLELKAPSRLRKVGYLYV